MSRAGGRVSAPRVRWLAGAVVATAVAVVFTTWGDGVPPVASGRWGALVDSGHAGAWILLAVAAWLATVTGRWTRPSTACAVAALALYLVFLGALLT